VVRETAVEAKRAAMAEMEAQPVVAGAKHRSRYVDHSLCNRFRMHKNVVRLAKSRLCRPHIFRLFGSR